MNARTLIAAVAIFAATGAAFAADSTSAASTAAPVAAAAVVQSLNLPTVSISASRSRADVKAEAADFVAHYRTALATQLELANNLPQAAAH
jgi:curli biogenesis system outer membrane secretion channel CsgG